MNGEDPIIESIVKGYTFVSIIRILETILCLNTRTDCLTVPATALHVYDDIAVYVTLRVWMVDYQITAIDQLRKISFHIFQI